VIAVVGLHAGWLPGGFLGVDLFFVLSGFLITTILLGEWDQNRSIRARQFYLRRGFRLVPALAALLGCYLAYGLLTGRVGSDEHVLTAAAIGSAYVQNFFVTASSHLVAGHLVFLWSLAAEEQFYLLWPLVLLIALRRGWSPKMILALLGGLVAAATIDRISLFLAGATSDRIYFGPDTHCDALIVGCAAAIAWSYGSLRISWRGALIATGVAIAAIGIVPSFTKSERSIFMITSPFFPLACAAIIIYCVGASDALGSRLLSPRPLRYVGKVSYGIYLWHVPLMRLAGVPVGIALTAITAGMSYRYLEAPIRRAGVRRWAQKPEHPASRQKPDTTVSPALRPTTEAA
jgi:peptidoglycan/LPS O-acetylase OafA/YrhL